MLKDFAISIARTLHDQGYQAYLVGGCVRDLLLGREPADYDIATDATPEQVMRIFPQTYAVGAQFGVVLVPMAEDPSVTSVVDQADVNHRRHRGKPSRSQPSVRISAIPTAAIPTRYDSARIPARTFSAAISPSTACCWTPSRTKCSILLVGERIWTLESSARSASQSCVLPKTSCECCARCDSPRDSVTPLSRKRLLPFKSLHRKFTKSHVSGFGMNLPKCLPKARRGVPSCCSMKPDCCMSFFLKSKP